MFYTKRPVEDGINVWLGDGFHENMVHRSFSESKK